MPESLDDFLMTRAPTAERPLLGQTVLAVEDSRFASEALRLICQRSGARLRRADCLRSAKRHLLAYRPGIVIVDLGLPDGSGLDLISELASGEPRLDLIIAMSGNETLEGAATSAGADAFLAKPLASVAAFQHLVLAHLPVGAVPVSPYPVSDERVAPDRMAFRDDLTHVADLLIDTSDPNTLDYVTAFLTGIAKEADDDALGKATRDLADCRRNGKPLAGSISRLSDVVQARLETSISF